MTVVAKSRFDDRPATCGANPSSANAAVLSLYDTPFSEPASNALYTDFGSRFLACRCASATVSNHAFLPITNLSSAVPPGDSCRRVLGALRNQGSSDRGAASSVSRSINWVIAQLVCGENPASGFSSHALTGRARGPEPMVTATGRERREPTSRGVMRCDCLLYTSPSPRDRQKSRMP